MTSVTRHTLRIYAALSGLTEDKGDILDKLVPFLEPLLERANGKVYDPEVMSAALNRLYGWRVNRDVAEVFAERLLAKGYLKRVMPGTLVVNYRPPQDAGDGEIEIAEILERIADEFEVFPPKVTDLFQFDLTREQMKEVLIRFLARPIHHAGSFRSAPISVLRRTRFPVACFSPRQGFEHWGTRWRDRACVDRGPHAPSVMRASA